MPDEVVEALIDNVERFHISGVRLIRWGEPTLHPKYLEIICKLKGVSGGTHVHINTNGAFLDEKSMQQMIDSGER